MSDLSRQRPYAVFWWALAAGAFVWEFVRPLLSPPKRIMCAVRAPVAVPERRRTAADVAEYAGVLLVDAGPFLLAGLMVLAVRHGAHTRAAGLALGVLLAPEALFVLEESLRPPAEPTPGCLPEPSPYRPFLVALHWITSPAALVVLAGIAGARTRPDRGSLWRLAAAVAAVLAAVPLLPLVPPLADRLAGPALSAYGTPRYALAGGGFAHVLDLDQGRVEPAELYVGRRVAVVQALAPAGEPGHYYASVVSHGEAWATHYSPRGSTSRLHRLRVNAQGDVELGEPVSGRMRGIVHDLAVSPRGRIAYVRNAHVAGDDKQFTGVLGPRREWQVQGHSLYWLDEHRLALPGEPQVAGLQTALDTRLPPGDRRALGRAVAPRDGWNTHVLPLPDGRTLRASGRSVAIFDGAAPVRTVLTLTCGEVDGMALAPGGRHVLVRGYDASTMPHPMTGETPTPDPAKAPCGVTMYELIRADLDAGSHTVVWRGDSAGGDLAW
ncbi:hypothetical protein OUY22_29510 [Nonomuraea sp. MCN248]|uniref:Uncharacterized protein n=1 Tax=Nonomuraea corallina TaxID=2989783 RepID=A0ABT4SKB2_9ACTN|nr:hypothetical protein [Nonomuraea corallina]MDA0637564.1 hypothetical protein [Nonomuraea corallina]